MSGWKIITKLQKRKQVLEKDTRPQTMFFTVYAITQKCLSRPGGKLYVAFIDLRKAFDAIKCAM